MLTLHVLKGTTTMALDLMESQPISLSLRFQDLQAVNSAVGAFSQNFQIPATPKNVDFFDHYDGMGEVVSTFNPKRKYDAWISDDGLPVLQGSLQLLSILKSKGKAVSFEIVVVGNTGDLTATLRNNNLEDLDFSGLDHNFDSDTKLNNLLNNSITGTGISATYSGEFCYSPMLKRSTGVDYQTEPIDAAHLVPYIKVRKVLDAIFALAGYSYSSAFFANSGGGANVWMPVFRGGRYSLICKDDVPANFSSGLDTDATIAGGTFQGVLNINSYAAQLIPTTGEVLLKYASTAADYGSADHDEHSVWDDANHKFVAPHGRVYRLRLRNQVVNRTDVSGQIQIILKVNNVATEFRTIYCPAQWYVPQLRTELFELDLDANDEVTFFVKRLNSFGGNTKLGFAHTSNYPSRAYGLDGGVGDPYLFDVDVAANMPDTTCIDFLAGLQKTFNLVFVPDERTKTFKIEPARLYLSTGATLDWDAKIDYSKPLVHRPTTDLQSRIYEFAHAEGNDYVNASLQDSANRTAGRMRIVDVDNDWSTGTEEISNGFAAYVAVDTVGGLRTFIAYDTDGDIIDNQPPMLCYLADASRTQSFRVNRSGNIVARGQYAFFSPFSASPSTSTSTALLFGPDVFVDDAVQPSRTLYNEYWATYFQEQYFAESKIVECNAFLTPTDINQLDFSQSIRLRDGVYRILSIDNYTANAEESCRLTLIMVAGNIQLCEFIEPVVSNFGTVTFTNAATKSTGLAGSKKCCEYFGYNWDGNACSMPVGPGPTEPVVGTALDDFVNGVGPTNPVPSVPMTAVTEAISVTNDGIDAINFDSAAQPIPAGKVSTTTALQFASNTQLGKVDNITVSGATDLDAIKGKTDLIGLNAGSTAITSLTLEGTVIRADKILTTTALNFATQQQLLDIASNGLTLASHASSLADIDNKTDLINITEQHDLDNTKETVGNITSTAAGISGFTVAATAKPLTADQVSTTSTTNKFVSQAQVNKINFLTVTASADIDAVKDVTDAITVNGAGNVTGISVTGTVIDADNVSASGTNKFTTAANLTKVGFLSADATGITQITVSDTVVIQGDDVGNFFSGGTGGTATRTGVTGDRLITITNAGIMSEVADGSAGHFLKTDGSGNLSFAAASGGGGGWHGSTTQIKVLPTEWVGGDVGRAIVKIRIEDDTANVLGAQCDSSTGSIFAFNEIPTGYKATHVKVNASSTVSNGVDVLHYNIGTGATTNSTTGDTISTIDITDMTSAANNALVIKVTPGATTVFIYSAVITIAAV